MVWVFFCVVVFLYQNSKYHFLRIARKANSETIWDFIKDSFKFNHITDKYLAKAHYVYLHSNL